MAKQHSLSSASSRDTRWRHRWGFADSQFITHPDGSVELLGGRYALSGYRMPDFLPYVQTMLGVKLDLDDRIEEVANKPVPPARRNEAFCAAVAAAFAEADFTFDDAERLVHSHGQTTSDEVWPVLYGALARAVDMVFYCASDEHAQRIIALAEEHGVCLIPYGGGTSVSSALKLPSDDPRMMVSVDMSRMDQIEWLDEENLRVCVQAGMRGMELEKQLARRGYTTGHEPDSIELSTVGGWVATNASGMKKNRYGNIEDIVEDVTLITPRGVIAQTAPVCRAAIGVQPRSAVLGNEGNFGIITRAVLKIHPLPERVEYGSLVFPDFELGVDFLRALRRAGVLPASIRLVDNTQFRFGLALKQASDGWRKLFDDVKKSYLLKVKGFDGERMVAATIVYEGTRQEVSQQKAHVERLARQYSGIPAGAAAGERGYMLTYAIAYIRDYLSQYHVLGETFETSVPWSKIHEVIRAVRQRADALHAHYGLPGKCYVSQRVTQTYHTGVCIYFMYGFIATGVARPDKVFAEIEHGLREAIMEAGGSISHHHGVGKLRKDFMRQTLSADSIRWIRHMKQGVDPANVFGIRNNVFALADDEG